MTHEDKLALRLRDSAPKGTTDFKITNDWTGDWDVQFEVPSGEFTVVVSFTLDCYHIILGFDRESDAVVRLQGMVKQSALLELNERADSTINYIEKWLRGVFTESRE
jgi:hypothetical protein